MLFKNKENRKQKNRIQKGFNIMAKYSTYNNPATFTRNLLGSVDAPAATHEGGTGYLRTPKAELFLQVIGE